MKYIESYLEYETSFKTSSGIITIPKKHYTESELQAGKRQAIAIEENQLEELNKHPIFQSMAKKNKNGIRVLDFLPTKYRISSEIIKEKDNEIAELKKKLEAKT